MATIEVKLAIKPGRKVSKSQSERLPTMDKKAKEWVMKDSKSCLLLFAWTGRCPIRESLFANYGSSLSTSLPPGTMHKMSELLRCLADSEHPGHDNAIKLLQGGITSDSDNVQLDENTAPGFIKHLVEKQIILPMQAPLATSGWIEYQAEIKRMEKPKHGRKKKQSTSTCGRNNRNGRTDG